MKATCPSCGGLGYRPGKFIEDEEKILDTEGTEGRWFEAVQCKACDGMGCQWTVDSAPEMYPMMAPVKGF